VRFAVEGALDLDGVMDRDLIAVEEPDLFTELFVRMAGLR
jgi:hypothetical protein